MSVYTSKHGAVVFQTADATPIVVTLGPGLGSFSVAGLEAGQAEAIPVLDRGSFLELVEGDDTFPTGAIEVMQDGALTSSVTEKPMDAVMKEGKFSSGATSDAGGQVWTGAIVYTGTRAGVATTITLPNCRMKLDFGEKKEGNGFAISFICYGTPTRT
jgi:hypothetical protein